MVIIFIALSIWFNYNKCAEASTIDDVERRLSLRDISIRLPETPHLYSSPTIMHLSQLAIDAQHNDEDERMSEVAISAYFRSTHTHVRDYVKPFLKRLIREAHDSPQREHREGIGSIRRMMSGIGDREDQRALRYIHDMVTEATQGAIIDQQKKIDEMQEKLSTLWSKKKAGVAAGVTGIVTALISAGVTLAITFG